MKSIRYAYYWMLLLSWLGCHPVRAQHEADTWYFGERAGFSFRSGPPHVLLNSQMDAYEATTVLSHPATGRLQLYSNGAQVWDRTHQVMPNGSNLWGTSTLYGTERVASLATQGALLVPVPGDTAAYYLFTLQAGAKVIDLPVPAATRAGSLAYSFVDMRLHNGLGDVVSTIKNRLLDMGLTEKLTAVRHANGRDYWLISHEWLSNAFKVYPITASGVGPPARYALGPLQPTDTTSSGYYDQLTGTLKASPDGRKIVFDTPATAAPFGLYDFDAATGAVSNYVNLGVLLDAYGACFSPDNTKLYVPNFSRTPTGRHVNRISQYDLQAGDAAAIAASGQSILVDNPTTNIGPGYGSTPYSLQIGPDGRIYGASGYQSQGPEEQPDDYKNVFFVIHQPNARGFACDVQYQRFNFAGRNGAWGLPNFMQHYFNGLEPTLLLPTSPCDLTQATLYPNPVPDAFRVQLPDGCASSFQVVVYDAVGRRVHAQAGTTEAPIHVAGLASGWYLVELRSAQQRVIRQMIKR
ncbi:T9SS type A sorting domain-containing protein [Hymenobacter defluvii]|uniref:T9SS type A sorting domain-containing protein n=1 Tax=Hymenobacter defluvii TaxID=2054411 RepID=A0ABS3TGM2_9BACT|nr:T9SS type A sorting domain-containing protein [Hymenobacter defluvii]MBO3272338.1 T9SS type A sorting domain-containing protein [Hymenobacter defluvii]